MRSYIRFFSLLFFLFLAMMPLVVYGRLEPSSADLLEAAPAPDSSPQDWTFEVPLTLIPRAQAEDLVANCRYGVTTKSQTNQVDWVDDFGAGWFLDFLFESPPAANGAEYVGIVYLRQDKDADGNYLPTVTVIPPLTTTGLGATVQRNPGHIWIVGNEVDRGPDPGNPLSGRGDTFPDVYAKIYHDIYHFIKSYDPTALVAISGLVEVTPGRIEYLDKVWQAYKQTYNTNLPVDIWTMHLYILPEVTPTGQPNTIAGVAVGTNPALGIQESGGPAARCPLPEVYCTAEHDDINVFAEQVVRMRTWMANHGQRQKPLLITEYSILYPYLRDDGTCFPDEFGKCFDSQRVKTFMTNSFAYLENATHPQLGYSLDNDRLVQQWMWFSVYRSHLGYVSNLITADNPPQLTPAGQEFQITTMISRTLEVNLLPDNVNNPTLLLAGQSTVTANLKLNFRNNGTQRVNAPIQVTFYRDEQLTDEIGSATIPAPGPDFLGATGCATRPILATVNWPGLPVGEHPFWVKIDPAGAINENDESDNVATGIVTVTDSGLFLPVVLKG